MAYEVFFAPMVATAEAETTLPQESIPPPFVKEKSVYKKDTGEIVALVSGPTEESLEHYEDNEYGLVDGHHDGNLHQVDTATKGIMARTLPNETEVPLKWSRIRARRNNLLDSYRWTVMPDSPLTDTNQAEWLTYLQTLQGITANVSNPDDIVWPDTPSYIYAYNQE